MKIYLFLADPPKFGNSPGSDPFSHVNITVSVEAGIVWMDKLAINPSLGVASINLLLFHYALDIITQPSNYLVLFIEQSNSRMEFGHK